MTGHNKQPTQFYTMLLAWLGILLHNGARVTVQRQIDNKRITCQLDRDFAYHTNGFESNIQYRWQDVVHLFLLLLLQVLPQGQIAATDSTSLRTSLTETTAKTTISTLSTQSPTTARYTTTSGNYLQASYNHCIYISDMWAAKNHSKSRIATKPGAYTTPPPPTGRLQKA